MFPYLSALGDPDSRQLLDISNLFQMFKDLNLQLFMLGEDCWNPLTGSVLTSTVIMGVCVSAGGFPPMSAWFCSRFLPANVQQTVH